jgi:hypothetical protein
MKALGQSCPKVRFPAVPEHSSLPSPAGAVLVRVAPGTRPGLAYRWPRLQFRHGLRRAPPRGRSIGGCHRARNQEAAQESFFNERFCARGTGDAPTGAFPDCSFHTWERLPRSPRSFADCQGK